MRQFTDLGQALESGHTLYFKNVGRRLPALGEIVDQVRVATRARYWEAAIVCSAGMDPGYDVHQDAFELVVLQLSGAKRWTVYAGQERDEVAFSGNLQDGDMLYVPTNWWHFCEPLGQSTHATISFLA